MATAQYPDGASGTTGLATRVGALRQAAGLPEAEPRSLLDAALIELDAAVTALDRSRDRDADEPAPAVQDGRSADRRLLQAIFQQVPVALFLLGRDGTVRRANTAAATLVGATPGYATGRLFASLAEPASRAAVRSQLAAVLRTGESHLLTCGLYGPAGVVPCELAMGTVNVRGDDDRLLIVATPQVTQAPEASRATSRAGTPARSPARSGMQAKPSGAAKPAQSAKPAQPARSRPARSRPGAEGDPAADVAKVIASMTQRIDVVTAVNRLLLENVAASEGQLVQRFGRLLADQVATWVIIDLTQSGKLLRHTVAGPDEEDSASRAQAVMTVHPPSLSVPAQVAESGSSRLIAHPDDEQVLGVADDGKPLLLLLGGASVLCTPIAAAGVGYGTLTMVRNTACGTFGLADVGLAEEAGEQLARTITVQRAMRKRSDVAEALQGSLLPRELKPIPGVEVAAAHIPPTRGKEVGGDFYDVYPTPDGWGIAIGDVCGKGQDAAAVTAAARHAIRVLAHWNTDPAEVLRSANEIMLAEAFGGRFVTAGAAHLHWRDGTLRVTLGSAGHPGPVLVMQDGRTQLLEGGGVPLGIFTDGEAEVRELELRPGDILFFCTDGLTGAKSADHGYFGERLADALAGLAGHPPADVVATMQHTLMDFCDGVLLDDVTMLAMRVGAGP
ncbi:MAG TPA: SpoIIE family protein phosphatase [Streptosporangiaceae bacterium]|nr:SpoIIE family protein phosphatase [Streptosporangiaceae bacterium]